MRALKLAITTFVLFLAACSDGGPTDPEVRPGFTADAAAYQPYELATLRLNGAVAEGVVIEGTLGTVTVALIGNADSTMTFMVPATAGTHMLQFSVGNTAYSGSITVTTTQSVPDAPDFLTALSDAAESQLNLVANALSVQDLPGDSAIALEMLQEARDSLASFRALFAQMTPAEQQQLAAIINANLAAEQRAVLQGVPSGMKALAIPAVCAAQSTPLEQYQCTWGEFFGSLKVVAKHLTRAALAAQSTTITGLVGAGVAAFFTTQALLEGVDTFWQGVELLGIHGMLAWEIGAAVVNATADLFRSDVVAGEFGGLKPSAFALTNAVTLSSAASMTRVTHDRPLKFRFSPKLRPVQLADRALPLSWLNGALRLVAQYNSLVKPRYRLQFASPASSYPATVPHEQIDVEVVSNSRVQVKSVIGSGDTTQVIFTTTAGGIQKFSYDVVYTSGVYPTVRVRHEAELHPASYMLTNRTGSELPDTLRLMSRWTYPVLLLNNDGSRIAAPQHVDLWTESAYQGAYLTLRYFLDSEGDMKVELEPGHEKMVDTMTVNVMVDGAPLRTMTVIAHDSLTMYRRAVPGTWVHTFYSFDYQEGRRDVIQFNADGTARIIARTDYETGEPLPIANPNLDWGVQLSYQPEDPSKHRFVLRWEQDYVANTVDLRYGGTSFVTEGPGGRTTLVRQ